MKAIRRVITLAFAGLVSAGAAGTALATELSANVAMASDYLFRGVSQTDEKFSLQGGIDLSTESGFYAGTWASNVNYGTDSSTEQDIYFGYAGESAGGMGYDFGYILYLYEGDAEFTYSELAASVSIGDLTLGLIYSTEYLGDGGPRFIYPYVDYSIALPDDYALSLHLGLTDLDEEGLFEVGEDSYMDYSVGIGKTFDGFDLSLAYVGTTIDDLDAADARVVFTIGKSL